MDDLMLQARLDEFTTVKVSPIDNETYSEYIEEDTLGGSIGYFITLISNRPSSPRFEVLAKAPSFEAAGQIFRMIVEGNQRRLA